MDLEVFGWLVWALVKLAGLAVLGWWLQRYLV
jgi:predicted component of type VI protein secretion system